MNTVNALPPSPSHQPVRPVRPVMPEINLLDYIGVIMRRYKVVLLAFGIVFFIVAYKTYQMSPVYEAFSTIRIMDNKNNLTQMSPNYWVDPTTAMNTEIATLKSRAIAERVVRKLHLNWQISEKTKGFSFEIDDFSSAAKNPVYQIRMIASDTFEVKDSTGRMLIQGKSGEPVRLEDFSLLINDIKGKIGDSFKLNLLPLVDVAMQIQGGFNASEFDKQANIIRASYTSTDPVQARDMVNAFVNAYIDNSIEMQVEDKKHTVAFIEDQLKTLRGDLDKSEDKLQLYKSGKGMIQLDSEAGRLLAKISAMEMKIAELKVKENEYLTHLTPTHPAVKAIRNQMNAAASQLKIHEKQIKKLPVVEQDLTKLTRVSKVNSDIYTFLLQRHEEARIAMESTISNLAVLDTATIPKWPIKPNIQKNLLMGMLAGIGLGILLAFLLEYLDDTIKDGDQAKRAIGLSILGTIPEIRIDEVKQKSLPVPEAVPKLTRSNVSGLKEGLPSTRGLITQNEPRSLASEAFRALRTSLHFSAITEDKKIMVFTSTFPREGKSVVSANTATVIAQTGAKVLIIDCDLRRSSQHEKFGCSKSPGLTELLTRDITVEKAINKTAVPGIDLICAGTTPPNPSELLGSEAMRQLLLSQKQNYDYIIIDAPPVLAVTDAPVLTKVSDLVVLVMEAGRVPVKAAQHMREILGRINAPLAGIVINDKTGKGERYSYYSKSYYGKAYGYRQGYGYGYGDGYVYYSDEDPKIVRKLRRWESLIPEKLRRNFKK